MILKDVVGRPLYPSGGLIHQEQYTKSGPSHHEHIKTKFPYDEQISGSAPGPNIDYLKNCIDLFKIKKIKIPENK